MVEDKPTVGRRTTLRTAASVATMGLVGVGGCLGGDDEDDQDESTLVMGTAAEVSANFNAMSGLGSAVNESTDDVYLDVRPSDSMAANIGRLVNEEIDLGSIEVSSATDLADGQEPFDDIDLELQLISHSNVTDWFFVAVDDQISNIQDIGPDHLVSPGPEGSRVTSIMRRALELDGIEYEKRNIEYGDTASALSEGRIDVGLINVNNGAIDPISSGFVDEVKASVDGRILEMSDDHFEMIQDERGMFGFEFDFPDPDDWEYVPDNPRSISQGVYICGTDQTPYDPVYEMMSAMYENRDEMGTYHNLLSYYTNDEHWTFSPFEGYEFHPAAADVLQEVDLWQDDLTRADE